LNKAVTVGGMDYQYPEDIDDQKGIVQPIVIFIAEVRRKIK
jgi:hypothetical protein